jgi:hypothetical protein
MAAIGRTGGLNRGGRRREEASEDPAHDVT